MFDGKIVTMNSVQVSRRKTSYIIPAWALSISAHALIVILLLWQWQVWMINIKQGEFTVYVSLVSDGFYTTGKIESTEAKATTDHDQHLNNAVTEKSFDENLSLTSASQAGEARAVRDSDSSTRTSEDVTNDLQQTANLSDSAGARSSAALEGIIYPEYPAAARRRGQEGRVVYEVQISSEGRLLEAKLISSSRYPILDQAARRALEKANYRPAGSSLLNSGAVKRIAFVFRLEES